MGKYYAGQLLKLKKPHPRTYRVLDVNHYGAVLEYWEHTNPDNIIQFDANLSDMDYHLEPITKLDKVLA